MYKSESEDEVAHTKRLTMLLVKGDYYAGMEKMRTLGLQDYAYEYGESKMGTVFVVESTDSDVTDVMGIIIEWYHEDTSKRAPFADGSLLYYTTRTGEAL